MDQVTMHSIPFNKAPLPTLYSGKNLPVSTIKQSSAANIIEMVDPRISNIIILGSHTS